MQAQLAVVVMVLAASRFGKVDAMQTRAGKLVKCKEYLRLNALLNYRDIRELFEIKLKLKLSR